MKHPAAFVCLLVSALAVAADQPAGPRPEREPEPRGDRRPEGQPQGNQPIVIPLPRGLPPGAYMLVPLPSQPGQLRAAMEKAGQEAAVKEAREVAQKAQKVLEEARLNERKAAEAAALKADPSLEPVFDKLRKGQSNQAPNRRGNERGEQPAR